MNRFIKVLLIIAGSISILLGILGIFLPLLPTTPFLLLGAACYLKGSQRLYKYLINNRCLGSYIKNYQAGKGVPLKTKVYSITLLWGTIGFSALFIIPLLYVQIILFLIAAGVTWHILAMKTLKKE